MSDRLFERAVLDWLEDGADRTSPAAIDAVLLAVKTTPQERGLRPPWRFYPMPNYLRAVAPIAVVAIVAIGVIAATANRSGIGGPTAPPIATSDVTAGPTVLPTLGFSTAFSSTTYGYSAKSPEGWIVTFGTAHGTAATLALGEHTVPARYWDHVTPTTAVVTGSGIFGTSALLPAGMTEQAWIDLYQAPQIAADGRACIPERSTWDSITVDGHPGGIYTGCNFAEATLFVDGRVYDFYYVNMTAASATVATTGRQLLEAFLRTVTLSPELAATPSP